MYWNFVTLPQPFKFIFTEVSFCLFDRLAKIESYMEDDENSILMLLWNREKKSYEIHAKNYSSDHFVIFNFQNPVNFPP